MKRLFLDANVIFSAALSAEGRCRGLFRLAEQGYCQLLTSPHALTEAERNLTVKYPHTTWQSSLLGNEKWGFEPLSQWLKASFFRCDSRTLPTAILNLGRGKGCRKKG